MEKRESVDILQFTDYRRTIKDILDSYHHKWDYISELLQNAYAGIYEARKAKAKDPPWVIEVTLNQQEGFFEVTDFGIGVSREDIPKILAPGVSMSKPYLPGEKGLGLTFVLFSSDRFVIESCHGGSISAAQFDGACTWTTDETGTVPKANLVWIRQKEPTTGPSFTRIRVQGSRLYMDYTANKLEYILRTQTAVGNVLALFDDKIMEGVDVKMSHVDAQGNVTSRNVEPRYLFPAELWDRKVTVEQFKDDKVKGRKRDYTRYALVHSEHDPHGISYYAMYSTPENYGDAAVKKALSPRQYDEDGGILVESDIEPAIYVSVKGVPYGTRIPQPRTGWAGAWGGVYIIINHDKLVFDAGRKSFQEDADYVSLRQKVRRIFLDVIRPHHQDFSKPSGPVHPSLAGKEQIELYKESERWPDIELPVPIQKTPQTEQDVIALFHELLGADLIKGYHTRAIHQRKRYDSVVQYGIEPQHIGKKAWGDYTTRFKKAQAVEMMITLEYKYDLADLARDIEEEKKSPYHIDVLVCWCYNKKRLERAGWALDLLSEEDVLFHGTNYRLIPAAIHRPYVGESIDVMVLEKLAEQLRPDE